MNGRDIIKFIVYNGLFDKECTSEELTFVDHVPDLDDSAVEYDMHDSCGYEISRVRFFDGSIVKENIDSGEMDCVHMPELKSLDSVSAKNESISSYAVYTITFMQWIRSLDIHSIFTRIVNYADNDSNFSRNCKTLNQAVSYLENRSEDEDMLNLVELAWTQYMRECRNI